MQGLTLTIIFFFNDTATTEIYTLSLHDALPIAGTHARRQGASRAGTTLRVGLLQHPERAFAIGVEPAHADRARERIRPGRTVLHGAHRNAGWPSRSRALPCYEHEDVRDGVRTDEGAR